MDCQAKNQSIYWLLKGWIGLVPSKAWKRNVSTAKRFFKKMMRADHRRLPFTISVDKNPARVEVLNMTRKAQVKRLDRGDAMGQAKFVESLFGMAA